MNIYIPCRDVYDINYVRHSALREHTLHFIIVNPLSSKLESIKAQKNRIIKLGSECGEEFFIMQDDDIEHLGNGIELLIETIKQNPDHSAIGIWPYYNKPLINSDHVSTACMILRTKDVKGLQVDYNSGCFCSALIKQLPGKVKYLQQEDLIKEVK